MDEAEGAHLSGSADRARLRQDSLNRHGILAEFEQLLGGGEVVEEREAANGQLKELVLVIDWRRPLHVVVVVDALRGEERIVTVYEPDPDRWSRDYRRRRR
ncbi:MAG TPA: hypothetical protein VFW64_14810 [Pseudonocardiaceae bacterium]|nr:hypothetical protein [Pseudonocardiaceae bacterium]